MQRRSGRTYVSWEGVEWAICIVESVLREKRAADEEVVHENRPVGTMVRSIALYNRNCVENGIRG